MSRYALIDDGRELVVETSRDGKANVARLLVDGEEVDCQRKWRIDDVKLKGDGVVVRVSWWWAGRVLKCELLEKAGGRTHRTPFEPPEGTRAHRMWLLRQERPGWYAARHVAVAVGQILVGVLGVGVLLRSLLPRIDWSWLPSIPTGWIPDLSWIPDPFGWLPDVTMPEWVRDVAASWKWWGPVVIAIGIALQEMERRKKKQATNDDKSS